MSALLARGLGCGQRPGAPMSAGMIRLSWMMGSSFRYKLQFFIGKSGWHHVSLSSPNSILGLVEKSTLP
jgi:hypothetical protein